MNSVNTKNLSATPTRFTAKTVLFTGTLTLAAVLLSVLWMQSRAPIRIGVLHSTTGTMASSEINVLRATLLAVEEINAAGGLLGRRVETVVVDGESDPDVFAREAHRLIEAESVNALFGCWTSACRKTVLPVVVAHEHLLFYPLQYEGLESSSNVVYLGSLPNQQIVPAIKWALRSGRERVFLVGSDYVFPRVANAIIKDYVTRWQGEVVGEAYIPLGSQAVAEAVAKIATSRPDIILNTINGDTNVAFFKALRVAGIQSTDIPTMSFSISEPELATIGGSDMVGDFATWAYFQSVDGAKNQAFVEAYRKRYGSKQAIGDPMETAYVGVHIWAQAVRDAGVVNVAAVREHVGNQSFPGPGGMVYIDEENHHAWKRVRIGRIKEGGRFEIVWTSDGPVRPYPFPDTREQLEWDSYLRELYEGWGARWANPRR